MCLMIVLKVTKSQVFTLCLEDTIFEKPQAGGQIDTPPAVLGLNRSGWSCNTFKDLSDKICIANKKRCKYLIRQ